MFQKNHHTGVQSCYSYYRYLFGILFIYFVFPFQVHAQQQQALTLNPEKAITQYDHSIWQTNDGLLQNSVTCILQTSDGYLWLGTYDGLSQFDGSDFNNFDQKNTNVFKNGYIYSLYESHNKTLWIGTAGSGLISFKNGTFKSYLNRDTSTTYNTIKAITEDSTETLWLGTNGSGIIRFKNGSFAPVRAGASVKAKTINCILNRNNGDLWFGTQDHGILILHKGQFHFFSKKDGLRSNHIRTLFEDNNHKIWIGTENRGLDIYNKGRVTTITQKDGLTSNSILSFIIDRAGIKWVGTEGGGLNRMVKGKITHFTTNSGLSNDVIGSLFEDREGDLWIGTLGGGLNKLRDGKFTTYTTREGLSNNFIWTVYGDSHNNVWLGTNGSGVNILHDHKIQVIDKTNGLSGNVVRSLFEDNSHNMWIGTYHGVNIWHYGLVKQYTNRNGLSGNKVLAINEDYQHNIWLGTNKGLDRINNGKITKFTTKDGLSGNYIRTIYEDHDHHLWIGTKNGLSLSYNGSFKSFDTSDGLPSDDVISIYQDNKGTIWIGTFWGGLSRYKKGKFTNITTQSGLPDNVIYSISEDDFHNLWFSSNKGVFKIKLRELNDFADGKIDRINATTYGVAEGMKNTECNGGNYPARWQSPDGKLWFPTVGGITMLDPNNLRKNTLPPHVHIEMLYVDGKQLLPHEDIDLSAGNHRIVFHYTAISLISAAHVKFKYKLQGFDQSWIDAGSRRNAYYTNLPPGEYTFKVIASNNDKVWNTKGSEFTFIIPTPIYKTYWAFGMYTVTIFLALFGFIRWQSDVARNKEIEKSDKEQLRLKAEQERLKRLAAESEARERENNLRLMAQEQEIEFEKERRKHESSVAKAFAHGVEEERERIARELHDHILGSLSFTMRKIQKILRNFLHISDQENLQEDFSNEFKMILPDLEQIGQDIREIMDDLKPGSLEFFGLIESLEALLNKQVDAVNKPVKSRVTSPEKITSLDSFTKITIFRIFQEAVTNALNHANPSLLELNIEQFNDEVVFIFQDDGIGFNFEETILHQKDRKDKGGHGLMNMIHRANTINADINWEQAKPHGTLMKLAIPVREHRA